MKERYEWNSRFDEAIKDNQTGDIVNAVEVLNKQDKRIKELEEENKNLIKALNGEIFINYKLPMENAQLKQQLEDKEKEHELLINDFKEETEKLRKQIKQESDARERFVKKVEELKYQLAEKDKMIEELRDEIARQEYAENTTDYLVRKNIKEKEIHKQVCDEIRQAFNKEDFWLYGDNNKIISIREDKFFEILDQIEQAKEK